ncbi:LysR family transcriptional regulator [Humibacter ginsenosidimutans]|uniref:LysR family transcriptional regulator n=1 Tax=Humibacter ginsenosidimutans TaxID=2599293 RepID=A0A5B8M3Q2_9MICO|nr:LysR family transcriptional regulator [Humibacter ginsenosidimutans]QDZ14210.1 LysR family transcriptional regulator [Humibacter ginsenosidimutans]
MTLQSDPSLDVELDAHTLRIVRALVEHGSITAAAESLGYSQPAISQHLRRAEVRLGMPLVARSGRGVRLTEAGLVLARHARTVTTALDAAAGELAELAGLRSGRVRLAAFPTASSTVVPRVLQQLAQTHAGIGVSYLEAEPPEAVDAVRDARADLAITFSYPGDADDPHGESARGLHVQPLWHDEMMIAVPKGHPVARHRAVRLGELADEQWIAGCPRCRGHLLQLAQASDFQPGIAYETDNFTAVLGMVAAGLGVALLPALTLASAQLPPEVVIRPTANRDRRTIHLVSAQGALDVPAIAATARSILALDGAAWGLTPTRTPAP